MNYLTVLSGGGSPHGDQYRPVYDLIQAEANRLRIPSTVIDYVGIGHYPDFGPGLTMPLAVEKALNDIGKLKFEGGGTLLCRSFGCNLGMWLFAHHSDDMKRFHRLVLWGPAAFHTYWRLVASDSDALKQFNDSAKSKGLLFGSQFWKSFCPMEELVRLLKDVRVSIGFGTKDAYCDAAFADYLYMLIKVYSDCDIGRPTMIAEARHEVRPDDNDKIKSQYFRFIFEQ